MSLAENLASVESRILATCERAGRSRDELTLVAVSKFHPVSSIRQLYDLGVRDFGESRVQELLDKRPQLPEDIRWHFIGPVQSNKAKYLAPFVDLVHALETASGLEELEKQARANERKLDVLIQVNISNEEQKHGVDQADLIGLLEKSLTGSHLIVRGLMGMASFEENPENTREQFRRLK